jgi:hypothetical protein
MTAPNDAGLPSARRAFLVRRVRVPVLDVAAMRARFFVRAYSSLHHAVRETEA